MMKYINEEGQIVNAKEGIRLDANHDLYKDSETGEFLIVKRFYIYNKENININLNILTTNLNITMSYYYLNLENHTFASLKTS